MRRSYSLAHLTVLGCSPPEAIRIAADTGYDWVGLRTLPLGLPGEPRYALAEDRPTFRATRDALAATGIRLLDIEVAVIAMDRDVASYAAALDDAAELGGRHVLCNAWSGSPDFIADQFGRLCALAAPRGLQVNIEFVTFTEIVDLAAARRLLDAVSAPNAGIVIDTLHFLRSGVSLAEVDELPAGMIPYLQLCDGGPAVSPSDEELRRVARSERLYPGEGIAPIREVVSRLPTVPLAVEVIHAERVAAMGYEAFARACLDCTKRTLEA